MAVNEDILWRISEFLESDLAMCVRLAAVNQEFYSVFTSDRLWKQFNPYNVEKDIFRSYQLAYEGPLDSKLLKFYWVDGNLSTGPLSVKQLKRVTKNHFVWMGFLRREFGYLGEFLEYPSLVECVVNMAFTGDVYVVEPEFIRQSKEWALKLVRQWPELYQSFSKFWRDHDVVTAAAYGKVTNYDYSPCLSRLHFGRAILNGPVGEVAVLNDPRNISKVEPELRENLILNREWALETIGSFPELILDFHCYQDNEEFILKAYTGTPKFLEQCSRSFRWASERIRRMPDFCGKAVAQSPYNIEFCLVNDIKLLKNALRRGERSRFEKDRFPQLVHEIYGDTFKRDVEANLLLAFAIGPSFARKGACPGLLESNATEALVAAVGTPLLSPAILSLPQKFIKDPEFLLMAIPGMGARCWSLIPDDMKRNKDIAMAALKNGVPLEEFEEYTGQLFSSDREMVKLSAQCTDSNHLFKIPAQFADDDEIVEIAVSKRACALQYASERLRRNRRIVLKALDVTAHKLAGTRVVCIPYKFVAASLLEEPEFLEEAIRNSFTCPSKYLKSESAALEALKFSPHLYGSLPLSLKNNLEFNMRAARISAGTLAYMDDDILREQVQDANYEYGTFDGSYCSECFD